MAYKTEEQQHQTPQETRKAKQQHHKATGQAPAPAQTTTNSHYNNKNNKKVNSLTNKVNDNQKQGNINTGTANAMKKATAKPTKN